MRRRTGLVILRNKQTFGGLITFTLDLGVGFFFYSTPETASDQGDWTTKGAVLTLLFDQGQTLLDSFFIGSTKDFCRVRQEWCGRKGTHGCEKSDLLKSPCHGHQASVFTSGTRTFYGLMP